MNTNQGDTVYDTRDCKAEWTQSEEDEELANQSHILQLRDYLLDLEERIFNADFGDAFEDENERKLVIFGKQIRIFSKILLNFF